MLNKTLLLLIFSLLFTSCVTKPIDVPATPAVRLEETVTVLEARLVDLQSPLEQTITTVSTVTPLPSTIPTFEPTTIPPAKPSTQVTPCIGPVKISAIAYAPTGDAIYLARTIAIQRNQDGIE